jgi:hypothetical protein
VLAVVTTWSGLDTLDAKGDLPSRRASDYPDAKADVQDRATRTDWLLGATFLTGVATAALGAWWVDWGKDHDIKVGSAVLPKGAGIHLGGRFD